MRSEYEVNNAIEQYADMIQRICLYHLKNSTDTEDVFQNIFLKYMLYDGNFVDKEHEKAWFIRVSINACKDFLKSILRHPAISMELLAEQTIEMDLHHFEILEAVLNLPKKYRDVVYLHYYEGYPATTIAQILMTKENTVYSILCRARGMLKKKLGGDDFDESNP